MPISAFPFELKQLDEQGTFEGLASTYALDSVGDQCVKGCFTATLASGKSRPLLLGHKDPIGVVELSDSPQGLRAKGKLALNVQQARDAWELAKIGALPALSIGYTAVKSDYVGATRMLSEVKIYEISLVSCPANEMAVVTSVKSVQHQQQILTALASFRQELLSALEKRQS